MNDCKSLKKEIGRWSIAWSKKLFANIENDKTLWDELINEANALFENQPQELRSLYAIAYMQSLSAYYSFMMNKNTYNDFQTKAIKFSDWAIGEIISKQETPLQSVA